MKEIAPRNLHGRAQLGDIQPEHADASIAETRDVHLRDYLRVLIRHRRLIVIVVLIVIGAAAYVNFSATHLYKASATLKIEPQNPTVTGLAEMLQISDSGRQYDYYQTQFILLEGRALAEKVVADLKLESVPEFASARVVSGSVVERIKSWVMGKFAFVVSIVDSYFNPPDANNRDPNTEQASANVVAANKKPKVKPWLVNRYLNFLFNFPHLPDGFHNSLPTLMPMASFR
jgi:uncharacterized protein involved in exopolysaccharide biosynthesis